MIKLFQLTFCATVIVLFLFVLSTTASVQTRRICSILQSKIEFTVKTSSWPIDYDVSLNQQQLSCFDNRFRSSHLNSNERALRFASSQNSVVLQTNFKAAQLTPNRFCVHVQSVEVEILKNLKVSILGEHRCGTCRYKAVLDHEHEHVAIFNTASEYLSKLSMTCYGGSFTIFNLALNQQDAKRAKEHLRTLRPVLIGLRL